MDLTRIKVGTRIKITATRNDGQYAVGDKGTVTNGSVFHDGDNILDRDGHVWAAIDGQPCGHKCTCITEGHFKVLKY